MAQTLGSLQRVEYLQYIKSKAWKAKRAKVLARAGGRCERCKDTNAAHVHHRTYAHFKRERMEDLEAVCVPCHQALHPNNPVSQRTVLPSDRALHRAKKKLVKMAEKAKTKKAKKARRTRARGAYDRRYGQAQMAKTTTWDMRERLLEQFKTQG